MRTNKGKEIIPPSLRNFTKPTLKVRHKDLQAWDVPWTNSYFKKVCPVCKDGCLPVSRSFSNGQCLPLDRCDGCGQQVEYIDYDESLKGK